MRVNLAKPVDLSAACTLTRLLGRTIGGMVSGTTQKSPGPIKQFKNIYYFTILCLQCLGFMDLTMGDVELFPNVNSTGLIYISERSPHFSHPDFHLKVGGAANKAICL